MAYSLDNQLGVIRARIEAELARPTVVAVTSAVRRDGKTMIANGVAEAMSRAGHRVLIIDAATNTTTARALANEINDVLKAIRPGSNFEPDYLALVPLTPASGSFSLQTLRAMFAWCREEYDYVFVDTNAAFGSPLGMSLSAAADSVIIALRYGRAASSVDRELVAALAAAKANVLGVVTTNAAAIDAYSRTSAERPAYADRSVRKSSAIVTTSTVAREVRL